jgi:hypothetical protein
VSLTLPRISRPASVIRDDNTSVLRRKILEEWSGVTSCIRYGFSEEVNIKITKEEKREK